jgi:Fic family protein
MDILLTWANENEPKLHPVIVSAIFHYNFVRIHPFPDGNGRLARLLMNLFVLRNTFTPINIDSSERDEYLRCLAEGDQSQNLTPFVEFIAAKMLDTQKELLELYMPQNE